MELKGAAIKYLEADTEPYAEIIGTSYTFVLIPVCPGSANKVTLIHVFFCYKGWF